MEYEFTTKQEMLEKLRKYAKTSDDENIRFKEKIKNALLHCPELLYSLHEKSLESELFDEDGNLMEDGDWFSYFSNSSNDGNIRPYLYIPETQTEVKNYLCYQTSFDDVPRYNDIEKYQYITFTIFVHGEDGMDALTGIARHDLIGSILRERFSWSNIFGCQCKIVSDKESITDNHYLVRTIVMQVMSLNSIAKTTNQRTQIINNKIRL